MGLSTYTLGPYELYRAFSKLRVRFVFLLEGLQNIGGCIYIYIYIGFDYVWKFPHEALGLVSRLWACKLKSALLKRKHYQRTGGLQQI